LIPVEIARSCASDSWVAMFLAVPFKSLVLVNPLNEGMVMASRMAPRS
jgi:hypothetical protein